MLDKFGWTGSDPVQRYMRNNVVKLIFLILGLLGGLVFLFVLDSPRAEFNLVACDVGQGDALLAFYKTDQILIDGGPNSSVLDCLSRYMPFWDKKIELVVLTHPEKDHFRGLIDVFENYKVDTFLALPIDSSSQEYGLLKDKVGSGRVRVIEPDVGKEVRVGLMHFVILHPSQKFLAENSSFKEVEKIDQNTSVLGARTTSKSPNDFSINLILSFGEFDALLTGDLSPSSALEVESAFSSLGLSSKLPLEYIKVPHHGSKNGLTQDLLELVKPKVAVISVGKNSYGHPHKEMLDMLSSFGVSVFRTDEIGDVVVSSDGKKFWVKR